MQMRTTKPTTGNKFYITTSKGGYSWCIQGYPTDSQCNVLSNCVGYACGRFNEIIGSMKYPALNCNAENFIERAQSLGLTIEQTPSLGAIMVWQKGSLSSSDGAGHVEVVERIDSSTQVMTSASNYAGTAFYNAIRKKAPNWNCWSGYTFRGFIKNPSVVPEPSPTPSGDVEVGDIVNFTGGAVYSASLATNPATTKGASKCKVTSIANGAKHEYHLVSQDGNGVYGWVDAVNIKELVNPDPPAPAPSGLSYIKIGPASPGDVTNIVNYVTPRAESLGLPVVVEPVK